MIRKAIDFLLVVGVITAIAFGLRDGVVSRVQWPILPHSTWDEEFASVRPLVSGERTVGLIVAGKSGLDLAGPSMQASYALAPAHVEPEEARDEWIIVEGPDEAAIAALLAEHKLVAVQSMGKGRMLARRAR